MPPLRPSTVSLCKGPFTQHDLRAPKVMQGETVILVFKCGGEEAGLQPAASPTPHLNHQDYELLIYVGEGLVHGDPQPPT